jgi:proline iminopeptidase
MMHRTLVSLAFASIGLLTIFPGCLDPADPGLLVPATVDDDPSLPSIDIAGTRLHAEAFGDPGNPVIMVLHSGPGSDYRGLLPLSALASDGYRVVFWDQRGSGLSRRHDPDTIDLETYIEDLRQVIEHYAPDRPLVFIGQSWGAMYATAFINKYGDHDGRIRGAILTEPGAFTSEQLRRFIKRLQGSVSLIGEDLNDALWAEQFLSRADHERADYQAALLALRGAPSEQRNPDNLTPFWRVGSVANRRLLKVAKEAFDWTTHLAAFPHKVLFLRGDRNEVVTLEHQQELAASYPNAEIQTITGAGHHVIWERTEEYLTHVRAYLAQIGGGR